MKRAILVTALAAMAAGLALAAPAPPPTPPKAPVKAPAPPPKPPREPTRQETLTKRIHDTEVKLRAEKDPAIRQTLADAIETFKHELGPTDATGARVRCQAMWHDAMMETLETESKRLAGRAKAAPSGAQAFEAKALVRQMAAKCLERAWVWGGVLPKYQFDAFGQYLANNLPLLDGLFESVAGAMAKESTLPPAAPDREAFLAAVADAKDGIGRMGKAADQFINIDMKAEGARQTVVAALGVFAQGLQTVYEADLALRELAEKQRKPGTGTPTATQAQPPAPEGPTAEEKGRIEKVRAAAASLGDDAAWQKIRAALERFATVAEQGLQVSRARPGAQELLDTLVRTAEYVRGLKQSKSAYPEYLPRRLTSLETSLEYMADKRSRRQGYSHLRRMCMSDGDRLALDASPLSPEAAKGLLRDLAISYRAFTNASAGEYFPSHVAEIIGVLGRMRDGPPKDMTGQLLPLYKEFADVFVQSAEQAGKMPQTDADALVEPFKLVRIFGQDLERVIRADLVIKSVAQYAPQRAQPMYAQLVKKAEGLAQNTTPAKMTERSNLDEFFRPFQTLADLRLPGPEHQRFVSGVTGGAYPAALAVLGKEVTAGLTWASATRANSTALDSALEQQWLFRTLRHRAVAETSGAAKVGVTNLDAFSIPEKTWSQFVAALDQHLRQSTAQYAADFRARKPQTQFLAGWDTVYCWVASAQRQTAESRAGGANDMEALLRNLTQAADPTPPDTAWFGWMVGYHATEAATALAAGFEGTAGSHRSPVSEYRQEQRFDREFTSAILDPRK